MGPDPSLVPFGLQPEQFRIQSIGGEVDAPLVPMLVFDKVQCLMSPVLLAHGNSRDDPFLDGAASQS